MPGACWASEGSQGFLPWGGPTADSELPPPPLSAAHVYGPNALLGEVSTATSFTVWLALALLHQQLRSKMVPTYVTPAVPSGGSPQAPGHLLFAEEMLKWTHPLF